MISKGREFDELVLKLLDATEKEPFTATSSDVPMVFPNMYYSK